MNAMFFYFSGTGNSLDIAKRIVDTLGFGDIRSISKLSNENSVEIHDDMIGFIFPVYSQTIPGIVKRFIKKLNFKSNPYIFSIATNNGGPGRANFDIAEMLEKKNRVLNRGFTLLMPGNSVIIKDFTNPIEEQRTRLLNADIKVKEICHQLQNLTNGEIEGNRQLKWYLEGRITSFARIIYQLPKRFIIDSNKCTLCKSCIRLCPENNIRMVDIPTFGNNCTNCLSCYHWCPQKAINLGNKECNQYQNPNITISELFLR